MASPCMSASRLLHLHAGPGPAPADFMKPASMHLCAHAAPVADSPAASLSAWRPGGLVDFAVETLENLRSVACAPPPWRSELDRRAAALLELAEATGAQLSPRSQGAYERIQREFDRLIARVRPAAPPCPAQPCPALK